MSCHMGHSNNEVLLFLRNNSSYGIPIYKNPTRQIYNMSPPPTYDLPSQFQSPKTITPSNFYHQDWQEIETHQRLKLHDCLSPIPPNQTFSRLKNVCFSRNVLFQNLITVLENAPNLQILEFENPELTAGCLLLPEKPFLQVRNVTHLWFHNINLPLGGSEFPLLNFLLHGIDFPCLESFHFRSEMDEPVVGDTLGIPEMIDLIHNNENYGSDMDHSGTLARFLIKNNTVTDLALGGPGFKLNKGLQPETEVPELQSLELTHLLFSMDTQGIEHVLNGQTGLKYLTVKGGHPGQGVNRELFPAVLDLIERNCKTLKSFTWCFYHNNKGADPDELPAPEITYDGQVLGKCTSLRTLILSLVFTSDTQPSPAAGRFLNIYALPRTLQEISITCSEFNPDAFDLLGNMIAEFADLRLFYFCSLTSDHNQNQQRSTLKTEWLKGFKSLRHFQSAEFVNVDKDVEERRPLSAQTGPPTIGVAEIVMVETRNSVKFIRKISRE